MRTTGDGLTTISRMRSPEDAIVLAIWRGRNDRSGPSVDAYELAGYLEDVEERTVPQTPAAIERILTDLTSAGLVEEQARPLTPGHGRMIYHLYALTEEGLARARELEAADKLDQP